MKCLSKFKLSGFNPNYNQLWKLYILIIFLILSIVYFSRIWPEHVTGTRLEFWVAAISMLVAAITLLINTWTFQSIDTVSSISKMEGNVLENEYYSTNIISLLKPYEHCYTHTQFGEAYRLRLNNHFNKSHIKSGIQIADSLQDALDHVILQAFLVVDHGRVGQGKISLSEKDKDIHRMHIDRYINKMDSVLNEYQKKANGSVRILQEALNLLRAASDYQFVQDKNIASTEIMKLHGELLRNKVTQTLYLDYMGLCYMKYARTLMQGDTDKNKSSIDTYNGLINAKRKFSTLDETTRFLIIENLKDASIQFRQASEVMQDNLFWNTLDFNTGRAEFFLSLIDGGDDAKWQSIMQRAIFYRKKQILYLNQMLGKPTEKSFEDYSYLRAAMAEQYYQVVLHDILYRLVIGNRPETDQVMQRDINFLPNLKSIPSRSRSFQTMADDILSVIGS